MLTIESLKKELLCVDQLKKRWPSAFLLWKNGDRRDGRLANLAFVSYDEIIQNRHLVTDIDRWLLPDEELFIEKVRA